MSRTVTYICANCEQEDIVYSVHDGWMNYDTCKYCGLQFCANCLVDHMKEEK